MIAALTLLNIILLCVFWGLLLGEKKVDAQICKNIQVASCSEAAPPTGVGSGNCPLDFCPSGYTSTGNRVQTGRDPNFADICVQN